MNKKKYTEAYHRYIIKLPASLWRQLQFKVLESNYKNIRHYIIDLISRDLTT